jgi:hypothetical protein
MQSTAAGVPIPKFASLRAALRTNFEIDKDTGNSTILVRLLNPKFSTILAAGVFGLTVQAAERGSAQRIGGGASA